MRTIWKFPLEVTDCQEIEMPAGEPLHVATQEEQPFLWAEVTPGAALSKREIHIYGTGQPLAIDRGDYLGTFMLRGGALVFHAYASRPV